MSSYVQHALWLPFAAALVSASLGCASSVYLESALVPAPGPGNVTSETVPKKQMELSIGGEPLATIITRREDPRQDVPALWLPVSTIRGDVTFGVTSWMDVGGEATIGPGQFARPNRSWIVPIDNDRPVWGIATKISFRAGNPRKLAFRGTFEWGGYTIPAVLYECLDCVYETWTDEDGDGEQDSGEWEEQVRMPQPGDELTRVRSDNLKFQQVLISLAVSRRMESVGMIAGCTIRPRYENKGLHVSTSSRYTLSWDREHPYLVPYVGVDLYTGQHVLLQLQLFVPIDTAYRGKDWFRPGLSGSLRARFPLTDDEDDGDDD